MNKVDKQEIHLVQLYIIIRLNPIKVETFQVAFEIYELLLDNKLSSYEVGKKFNIIPKIIYWDKRDLAGERRVVCTKIS